MVTFGLSDRANVTVVSPGNRSGVLLMLQEVWLRPEDADQSWQGMCWRANCNS